MDSSGNRVTRAAVVLMVLIVALAAYLRWGAVNGTVIENPVRADAAEYLSYAYNLKFYHIYSSLRPGTDAVPTPDAVRPPGYPLFLSLFTNRVPSSAMLTNITLAQALLGLLTVLLSAALFRHVVSAPWALTTALLVALSPHLISMETYILSESLFTFLLVLSIWLIVQAMVARSVAIGSLAGLILGAAALTRPSLQYFIVPLSLVCMIGVRRVCPWRVFATLVLTFVVVVSAWVVRNELAIGRLSDPRLAINTLHHGMYPDFMYKGIPQSRGIPYAFDPKSNEIGKSFSSVIDAIGTRFASEPVRELRWYLLGKPVAFFSWDMVAGIGDVFVYPIKTSPYLTQKIFATTHMIMWWLHWPLTILACLAAILVFIPSCTREWLPEQVLLTRVIATLIFYFVVVHMVGAPFPRYSIPLLPFMFGMSMVGLGMMFHVVRRWWCRGQRG